MDTGPGHWVAPPDAAGDPFTSQRTPRASRRQRYDAALRIFAGPLTDKSLKAHPTGPHAGRPRRACSFDPGHAYPRVPAPLRRRRLFRASPPKQIRSMTMSFIRGPKDFWAGMLFIAIGAFAVIVALNYPMGTAARMGPGYFPRALGTLLIILGAVSLFRGLRQQGTPIMPWRFRPIVVVLGSTVLF